MEIMAHVEKANEVYWYQSENSKLSTSIYLLSFLKPKKALTIWAWKMGGNSNEGEVLTNIKGGKKKEEWLQIEKNYDSSACQETCQ